MIVPTQLQVWPSQVSPNQAVTISFYVTNKGDKSGQYEGTLYINGDVEGTQAISVARGETRPLVFTIYRSTAGNYQAFIDGYSDWFTVVKPDLNPVISGSGGGIGTIGIIAIVAGALGAGLGIYFGTRRREA